MRKPPEVCFGDLRANLQRFALGGKISMSGTVTEDLSRARNVVFAAFLSWTLDAFDYFILILTFDDVAKTFGVKETAIVWAVTLTLATRALGAFIFGRLADIYGRKPILVAVIISFS